ncbi:MAG: amino acid permease [Spirochaetes bacterium]|nr:amino acid permease [Spirochaetota bacterium]
MELKKGINFFGVFSIASGAMISSGIFILPGLAFSKAGPAMSISYLMAGLLGLMGILGVIELSTAMPKAGGDYYYINKSLGPLFGTISGIFGWFALTLKSSFAIFGIAEIVFIYIGISPLISGIVITLLFIVLNIVGVKEAAIFQTLMLVGLLAILIGFIVAGVPVIDVSNFEPFFTKEVNDIIITSGFIFISFGGLLKVVNISEEVKNPKKNIPLGIISSIVVVSLLYTFITIVITGTLQPDALSQSLTPVADSAKKIMGPAGYFIIIIASFLAFFTTANAGIMSASRYPMALSRDNLIPGVFARINKKYNTPVISILLTGLVIYLSLLLPLEILVKTASTVILTSYVLTNLSVIIFRESGIINYKPSFKSPFYPWTQIISIILFSFFIIDLGMQAIEISLSFLFISFCIYMFYGHKKKDKEFVLLNLLKKIVDKNLIANSIEDELRDIIIDRDNIEQDNFDQLIKNAKFFDLEYPMDFETMLKHVVKDIAGEIDMEEQEVMKRFIKRQEESNTALSDFLAIPHIIIDGSEKMFMTIVRCNDGIRFTEEEDKIKAVFLLGGTPEKRLLHLKCLASIATLIGEKDFKKKWKNAASPVELKNLMALSSRKRFI